MLEALEEPKESLFSVPESSLRIFSLCLKTTINAMTTAVPILVHGLTRGLFRSDIDKHWASFNIYDVPQAVIDRKRTYADP